MGNTVLTWEIVRVIRHLRNAWVPQKRLASQFNISKGHVSDIVNNKIWIEGKAYHPGPQDVSDFTKPQEVVG
jgi:hypothetical protein